MKNIERKKKLTKIDPKSLLSENRFRRFNWKSFHSKNKFHFKCSITTLRYNGTVILHNLCMGCYWWATNFRYVLHNVCRSYYMPTQRIRVNTIHYTCLYRTMFICSYVFEIGNSILAIRFLSDWFACVWNKNDLHGWNWFIVSNQ